MVEAKKLMSELSQQALKSIDVGTSALGLNAAQPWTRYFKRNWLICSDVDGLRVCHTE